MMPMALRWSLVPYTSVLDVGDHDNVIIAVVIAEVLLLLQR